MTRRITLALTALLLLGFVVLPLSRLMLELSLDTFQAAWSALHLKAAFNTVWLALGTCALSLVLGVPLGFLFGRSDLPNARRWRTLATVPYMVPPYVMAIAWISLLNPTSGILNRALAGAGLGPINIYGLPGMIWVLGLAYTPFIMLATSDALARMDASLEEQARIAGASPLEALRRITLPMAWPAVLQGVSFVLAASAASFGVPYLLATGDSSPTHVLTTRIYQVLDLDPATGRPIAVALAVGLLLFGLGLPWIAKRLQARARFTTVTGKASRANPFELGRAMPLAKAFVYLYIGVAAVVPITTIAITSLMKSMGNGFRADNLGLETWRVTLLRADTWTAISHSVVLAVGAATAATILGALIAWTAQRTNLPGRHLLQGAARLPYIIPGTVLALALLLTWSQELRVIVLERATFALSLGDTLWMLGLAYTVKFLTFPVGNADAGLQALDPTLEEAAAMSGATWAQTLRKVTWPLLRPNLTAGWFLVLMPAFSEVTMSILLAGPDSAVIGTRLFELQTYGDPPGAAVLAIAITALALGGNAVVRRATGGKAGL